MYTSPSRPTHISTSSRKYKIIVSGIPANSSMEEFSHFICQYGHFDHIKKISKNKRTPQYKSFLEEEYISGVCILTTSSWSTSKRIMVDNKIMFRGRALRCQRFLESDDGRFDSIPQDRKITVKQISLDVDLEELRLVLESIVQSTVTLATLKRSAYEIRSTRKYLTCSAILSSSKDAERLLRLGSVPNPDGKPILFKKYEGRLFNLPSKMTKFEQVANSASTFLSDFRSKQLLAERSLGSENLRFTSQPSSSTYDMASPSMRVQAGQNQMGSRQEEEEEEGRGESGAIARFHGETPTSTKYYKYRRLIPNISSSSSIKGAEETNVRINMSTSISRINH